MDSESLEHRKIVKRYLLLAEPILFVVLVVWLLSSVDLTHRLVLALVGMAVLFGGNVSFFLQKRLSSRSGRYFLLLSLHSLLFLLLSGCIVLYFALVRQPNEGLHREGAVTGLLLMSLMVALLGTAAKWLVWVLGTIHVARHAAAQRQG
jgi:hypothetical protein